MDLNSVDSLGMLFPHQPNTRPELMHPLVLAYVGDAIYDLYIRQYVISECNQKPHQLHRLAVKYVSARAQSRVVEALLHQLTDEEQDILRRGRNTKSGTQPKNANVLEYRHSTAFECLLGYLYYQRNYMRLQQVLQLSIEYVNAADAANGDSSKRL